MKISKSLKIYRGKPVLLQATLADGTVSFSDFGGPKTYFTSRAELHDPTPEDVYRWLPEYGDALYDFGYITWGTAE